MTATPLTHWASDFIDAIDSVDELLAAGLIEAAEVEPLRAVAARYQLRIPRYYADLIDRKALQRCPIRAQALPSLREVDPQLPEWAQQWCQRAYGTCVPWRADAIGDVAHKVAPRLTHRYVNRAILHVSAACALYCRFCFRKSHLNDVERTLYSGGLEPALDYLRAHPEIREVILTGGDPLSVRDAWLANLLAKIAEIRHIRQVRFHSRMAVTMPARLTDAFVQVLRDHPFAVTFVSHFNHPRELTPLARQRLVALRRAGVVLYNQAVLLRAVNDHADTLAELMTGLYEHGVTPYYLHHPDWTPGTFHFRLPIHRGRSLMSELQGRLSGPALPTYVLDVPGGLGKVRLMEAATQLQQERRADGLYGALYQLQAPHTRAGDGEHVLYADFCQLE